MSDENFITTFNHGYNGAAFVLLSDHKAEVQRLTNERDAMREQLRWRKCSEDGDPNKHGQYLTIVEGDRVMQNYNGLWDCHEYAATTHWLPIPPAELTGEAE